jgi:hypothetical protein
MRSYKRTVSLNFLYSLTCLALGVTGVLVSLYFKNRAGVILSGIVFGAGFLFYGVEWFFAKMFRLDITDPVKKPYDPSERFRVLSLLACLAVCMGVCFYVYHLLEGVQIHRLLLKVLELNGSTP